MLSQRQFEQIEYVFRHLKDVSKPFGGCQVILSKDFFQLPPVPTIEYGDPGKSIEESRLLVYFHHIHLTHVFRQKEIDLVQAIHEIARFDINLILSHTN
ncbi:uncharacterized protein LOC133195088 [Saccostrea echinata]|uniref:uncharacterized protein LOC133195088 n=1 Tax=Saccostrea echinata TaxID=191078 RepID=UPI002A7FDD91|nr:uncharacterized protein LOC133195088 [Saccostrea echinata]